MNRLTCVNVEECLGFYCETDYNIRECPICGEKLVDNTYSPAAKKIIDDISEVKMNKEQAEKAAIDFAVEKLKDGFTVSFLEVKINIPGFKVKITDFLGGNEEYTEFPFDEINMDKEQTAKEAIDFWYQMLKRGHTPELVAFREYVFVYWKGASGDCRRKFEYK